MIAARRVGRYTKYETTELTRMFSAGYSVYKICRNLNRSQNSIRNNLIRLGLIEGEITPRRKNNSLKKLELNQDCSSKLKNKLSYGFFLIAITFFLVINPHFNFVEIILNAYFIIIYS